MQLDRDKRKQLPPEVEKIDKRKQRYKLRRRIVNHMTGLAAIIGEIRKVSSSPERDFALIFKDESVYSRMRETLHVAFMENLNYKPKLVTLEYKELIRDTCISAGLKEVPSNKQLSDRHYRARLLESLDRIKSPYGKNSWYKVLCEREVNNRLDKVFGKQVVEERKKIVTCNNCYLEQKPVEDYVTCDRKHVVLERKKILACLKCLSEQEPVEKFVKCPRCGGEGAVIGNLYEGFSREEELNKLKKEGA